MFLGCAVFLAIQFIVVLARLPETKGLSLEEVMSIWKEDRSSRGSARLGMPGAARQGTR